jgi:Bacterial membrane protein YfhO
VPARETVKRPAVDSEASSFFLIALALVGVLLRDAVLSGHILGQTDFLFRFLPWSAHAPVGWRVRNPLLGDVPMQFYPWAVHARDAILDGRIPLWNSAAAAGQPFLAACITQVLSPFSLLTYALPFPASLTAVAAARLLVGGLGMFLFLRRIRLSIAACTFGGIAYLLNPYSIVWLEHPQASVAAWLPWILIAAESCTVRAGARVIAAMALVVALAVLSGHPETFQHIALLTAAYVAYRGFTAGRTLGSIGLAAAGSILGLLIASIQLVPFLEYSWQSHALALRSAMDGPIASNPPVSVVTTFVPDFYGTPTGRGYALAGTNYFAQQVYPGVATWLFAVLAPFNRRLRGFGVFFLVAAALAAAIMYGTVAARVALVLFPPLQVTLLWSFGFLVIACLVIAAAIGVDALVARMEPENLPGYLRLATVCSVACVAIGAVILAFWQGQHALLVESRLAVHTLRSVEWAGALLAATVLVVWTGRFAGRRLFGVAAASLLAIDLLVFANGFHALIPADLAFPRLPELSEIQADTSTFRVAGWADTLLPNTAQIYGLDDYRGYDALGVGRYSALLNAGFHFNGATHQLGTAASAPFLDLLNVKYVLTPPDIDLPVDHFQKLSSGPTAIYRNRHALDRAFLVNDVLVLPESKTLRRIRDGDLDLRRYAVVDAELDARFLPETTASATSDVVTLRAYGDERVVLDSYSGGRRLLVLLDAYYPGWTATVDRQPVPIHRVDYAFRAVAVPAGRHIVEFRYAPTSFRLGIVLSAIGLAAAAGLCCVRDRASVTGTAPDSPVRS